MQKGELGNKQDKAEVCSAASLWMDKKPSGIICHPQANDIARMKALDHNKWTTACLLIRLFWFWHWNQQVPRSCRRSHPLSYSKAACVPVMNCTAVKAVLNFLRCFCCFWRRQDRLLSADVDLKSILQSTAVFRYRVSLWASWNCKRSWGNFQKLWGWGWSLETRRQAAGISPCLSG